MSGSPLGHKRARPEDGHDLRPSKKQETTGIGIVRDDSVKQQDLSHNGTSDLGLSSVNYVVMHTDTNGEQPASKTEANRPIHAASNPNSPAHNPLTNPPTRSTGVLLNRVPQLPSHASRKTMYPMPGEGMLDYCLRRHYLPANHHLSWSQSTAAALRPFLALLPVRKIDRPKPLSFLVIWQPPPPGDSRNAKYYALFTQVGGRVAPRPCARCAGGGARWQACVVAPTEETAAVVDGACGCCLYNDLGNMCSFAQAARSTVEPRPGDRPVQEDGEFSTIVRAQTSYPQQAYPGARPVQDGGESSTIVVAQAPFPQQAYPGQHHEYNQRAQLQQQAPGPSLAVGRAQTPYPQPLSYPGQQHGYSQRVQLQQQAPGLSLAVSRAQTPYPQQAYPGQQHEYSQRVQMQQQALQALQANGTGAPPARNQFLYAGATIPDAQHQHERETERSKIEKELHRIAGEQLRLATYQKELLQRLQDLR